MGLLALAFSSFCKWRVRYSICCIAAYLDKCWIFSEIETMEKNVYCSGDNAEWRGNVGRGEARGFPWPPPWPSVTQSVRASQTVWLHVIMTNMPASQTLSGRTAWHLNCSNELSNLDAKEDVKDRHRRTVVRERQVKKEDVWLSYWL